MSKSGLESPARNEDRPLASGSVHRAGGFDTLATGDGSSTVASAPSRDRSAVALDIGRVSANRPVVESLPSNVQRGFVHELFEARAAARPNAIAIVHDRKILRYGDLNAQANRLAHLLRRSGVGPEERVAICIDRGFDMVVGLLATLKAGGAYVPLDPAYPLERLFYLLADTEPRVVLTDSNVREEVRNHLRSRSPTSRTLELDADSGLWTAERNSNPDPGATGLHSSSLAYVIYTSGSTGRPKGVMVEHAQLARLTASSDQRFRFDAADVWSFFHSFAFDFSVWEIWGALTRGATLVVVPPIVARSAGELYDLLASSGVTVLNQTPSAFRQLIAAQQTSPRAHRLRYVILGGEIVELATLKPWYSQDRNRNTELVNGYGITETTVFTTFQPLQPSDAECDGASSIGRSLEGARVYVLDRDGKQASAGVVGELHIGGIGVARGYQNRPNLTAERFVPDPFSGEPGARMYKSGDLGRYGPNGELEFHGRSDFQVKIRGFRIELGEIERRMLDHPLVQDAVVLAREYGAGDVRLVAYFVATARGNSPEPQELRAHLSRVLPAHMLPGAYIRLDSLPLTSNGKLDRGALPAPETSAVATRQNEAPVGDREVLLATLFAEVLGIDRVGRHDDFFDLGGQSLLALKAISRVRIQLGVDTKVGDLFAHPTVERFARQIDAEAARSPGEMRSKSPPAAAIERTPREEPIALSFAQQRLWFLSQMGASSAYHIHVALEVSGALDREVLRRALNRIVERHEALRTTFPQVAGLPSQRIAPPSARFALAERAVPAAGDTSEEIQRLRMLEETAEFDLEKGPLIRGQLLRVDEMRHFLLIAMHHIVSDGWSMALFAKELRTLYDAFRAGLADPLPPLEWQYADYSLWQKRSLSGDVLRTQSEYWRQALAGAPTCLHLPTDRPRPAEQMYSGGSVAVEIDRALTAGLNALSKRHGATLYMAILSAWALVLSRLSGQDDVVVGSPTANRTRREFEPLIGFFVNTLPIRLHLSPDGTIAGLLEHAKRRALEAQENQDLPFEEIVDLLRPPRSAAHTPLFQNVFVWQNNELTEFQLAGLTVTPMAPLTTVAKFDLLLDLYEIEGRIVGRLDYADELFARSTAERYVDDLQRILATMVQNEHCRLPEHANAP